MIVRYRTGRFYAHTSVHKQLDGRYYVKLNLEDIKEKAEAEMLQKQLEHFLVERYSKTGVVVWEKDER